MIFGYLVLFFTLSLSKFLDSDESNPSTDHTQDFEPGKVIFSSKQRFIIIFTASICALLIIIGIIIAIGFSRKNKKTLKTSDIENFILGPSLGSIDEVEL